MLNNTAFSKRLREAIDQKDMTQTELCQLTGIGKSAMSQYLRGSFLPKQQKLFRLAQALDVSEAWLMGYDVPAERRQRVCPADDSEISGQDGCGLGTSVDSADSTDDEAVSFYYSVTDSAMVRAGILPGARVLIDPKAVPVSGQVIAYGDPHGGSHVVGLRRYWEQDGFVLLIAESVDSSKLVTLSESDIKVKYMPLFFEKEAFDAGACPVRVMGVARKVIFDLD